MRLIDADKINFFDCLAKTGNSVCCHAKGIVSKEVIDVQPTVDAIPIEWVKKYIEDNTKVVKNPKYDGWYFSEEPIDYYIKFRPHDVEFMLNKWERENVV